jgi:hypothetical protein
MPEPTVPLEDVVDRLAVRRRWVDVLLIVVGVGAITGGWRLLGVALIGFGLVTPLLRRSGKRREAADLAHLVPPQLVAAHREVLAAAALPGVDGADAVIDASVDALLEVAAILLGRPPRGATQRRLVAAHMAAMAETAAQLRQWSEAWIAARAELEELCSVLPPERPVDQVDDRADLLVGVLTVTLAPFFIAWDGLRLTARALVLLVDGLALRIRTVACLVVRAASCIGALAVRAHQAWMAARVRVVAAAVNAHRRFGGTRAQILLRFRRARQHARRLDTG